MTDERPGELERFAFECALKAAHGTEFWVPAEAQYGFVDYFEAAAARNLGLLDGFAELAKTMNERGILPKPDSDQATLVTDGGQPTTAETETHAGGPSQPTDPELTHYRVGVIDLYLHDWAEGTRLYTTAGTTTSVREMAEHDGPVILDGKFRKMIEDGTVVEQHPHAGYCGAWTVNDETAQPATLLKEVHRHV